MTENITPPLSPQEKAVYKQDFARGANLFQQSLDEYEKATEEHKKAKFKEVMDEAMQIMNETAQIVLSKGGQKVEKRLDSHYQQFLTNATPDSITKLRQDINDMQKQV